MTINITVTGLWAYGGKIINKNQQNQILFLFCFHVIYIRRARKTQNKKTTALSTIFSHYQSGYKTVTRPVAMATKQTPGRLSQAIHWPRQATVIS